MTQFFLFENEHGKRFAVPETMVTFHEPEPARDDNMVLIVVTGRGQHLVKIIGSVAFDGIMDCHERFLDIILHRKIKNPSA